MKKILTVTVAASMALCATAAEGFISGTSFEGLSEGSNLIKGANDAGEVNQDNVCYWSTEAWTGTENPADYEGFFVVTNLSDDAVYAGDRPEEWADLTTNTKALAIDTDKPLNRFINDPDGDDITPESVSDKSVFFDSVVQFTATDASPSIAEGKDKLLVWLYSSPEDVSETTPGLFGEDTPMTSLVVTAGYYKEYGGTPYTTNYCVTAEGVSVNPDEWHRLTIKAFMSNGYSLFNVFVDGKQVSAAGEETDFISLKDKTDGGNIVGVAFDGKGMVDDIAFTTKDPFAVASYEVTVKLDDSDADAGSYKQYSIDGGETYVALDAVKVYGAGDVLVIPQSVTKILFKVAITNDEKKLDGVETNAGVYEDGGYYWIKEVTVADIISEGKGEVVLKVVDVPVTPTVGGTSYETEAALKAVVKAGTQVTVPSGWTVEGKVLKDNTGATFATFEYYNLALADGVVTATLDQKAAAPFAEAKDLLEGQEVFDLDETMDNEAPAVGVRIRTFNGLYYGLAIAAELGSWNGPASWEKSDSDGKVIQLKAPKQGDTGFYKVEVRDVNPTPAQ